MGMVLPRLWAVSATTALLLAACSSLTVPMNEPLHSGAGNSEYRLIDVNRLGGAESALVVAFGRGQSFRRI